MECDQGNRIEPSPDNVTRIPLPGDGQTVCLAVEAGDTVILPLDLPADFTSDDPTLRFKEADGALIIEDHGGSILLPGWIEGTADYWTFPIVVEDVHGAPIDVASWLAFTDLNLSISQ